MTTYRIEPLEWQKVPENQTMFYEHWIASTPFGDYQILGSQSGSYSFVDLKERQPEEFESFKSAKAAVQAHWEERLKQCLEVVE